MKVTISDKLIKSRDEQKKTALIPPSGGELL